MTKTKTKAKVILTEPINLSKTIILANKISKYMSQLFNLKFLKLEQASLKEEV